MNAVAEQTFEKSVEQLIEKHSTNAGGTSAWIDWDAIYSGLLDEGYKNDVDVLLDEYIENNGY